MVNPPHSTHPQTAWRFAVRKPANQNSESDASPLSSAWRYYTPRASPRNLFRCQPPQKGGVGQSTTSRGFQERETRYLDEPPRPAPSCPNGGLKSPQLSGALAPKSMGASLGKKASFCPCRPPLARRLSGYMVFLCEPLTRSTRGKKKRAGIPRLDRASDKPQYMF